MAQAAAACSRHMRICFLRSAPTCMEQVSPTAGTLSEPQIVGMARLSLSVSCFRNGWHMLARPYQALPACQAER